MSRSKWKGPYVNPKLLKISITNQFNLKNEIKTLSRNTEIIPKFVGMILQIYNGKTFLKIKITYEMIGHKLGEFSITRKKFSFKKK